MKRIAILLIFYGLAATACNNEPPPPPTNTPVFTQSLPELWTATPTITATATVTFTPTPTPQPTSTPLPTQTAFPSPEVALAEDGPWLIGTTGQEYVAMNPDGSGLTALPYGTGVWNEKGWLAARVSSNFNSPYDASIEIIRLPALEPIKSIPLFSAELADEIRQNSNWNIDDARDVHQAVLTDLPTMIWSPDGRYLAFVGAIDGPSADLYVYDTLRDRVTRLTKSENHPVIMGWSPNNRSIVHMEAINFRTDAGGAATSFGVIAVWSAQSSGSRARELYQVDDGAQLLQGWRSSSEFLVRSNLAGSAPSRLRVVNSTSGRVTDLYQQTVPKLDVNPKTGAIVFLGEPVQNSSAVFVVPARSVTPIEIEGVPWRSPGQVAWSVESGVFYVAFPRGTLAISPSGEIVDQFEGECIPLASPNGEWLLAGRWDCPSGSITNSGLRLYSENGAFVGDYITDEIAMPLWNPESDGVYFNSRLPRNGDYFADLRFIAFPEGDVKIVHSTAGASFFAWVQP